MNLKITCDSFNPYFADICNDLHNYDFNICYRFVDNYYPQKNNSLYNSFKNKNFKKYTNLIFSKLKNCTLDVQADKNILILNDDLDYDYSVYKDVSQRLDMIFVHNNHFKKMINKLMIDHNKNRILNYYAISRNFNLPKKFTYNIDTNVEGKKWRLFLASYARAFDDYRNIIFNICTDSSIQQFSYEVNKLFEINKLNINALDSVIFSRKDYMVDNSGFNCYLCSGDKVLDRNLYDCMINKIPIVVLKNHYHHDYLRSNTCYYVNRNEDILKAIQDVRNEKYFSKVELGHSISKSFFDKNIFFEALTSEISKNINKKDRLKLSVFYDNGQDNVLI